MNDDDPSDGPRYPHGKLCEEDEGEINAILGVLDNVVVISFPKPVKWLGLDRATAINLAHQIISYANQIPEPPTGASNGGGATDDADGNE